MTGALNDYFVNHFRSTKFPWVIYHYPLERSLEQFLKRVASTDPDAEVLVVGCGLLHELRRAPPGLRFTAIDTDRRAVEHVQSMHGDRVRTRVVDPEEDFAHWDQRYGAIYGKEVIEHIDDWRSYLRNLFRLLKPGGALWLSTPNYGEPWLPLIESTFLELMARRSGYSRKHLHPSKLSARMLAQGLRDAGFSQVDVRLTLHRLTIVATCVK